MSSIDTPGVVLSAIQKAYVRGADSTLPLGGVDCIAYVEFRDGTFDVESFPAAVTSLRRHPCLRAVLRGDVLVDEPADEEPTQIEDLRALDERSLRRRLAELRAGLRGFRPDLAAGRSWQLCLSLLPDGHRIVHLAVSLVVTDLAGIGTMMADLAAALRGECRPPVSMDGLSARLEEGRPAPRRIPALEASQEHALFAPPTLPRTHKESAKSAARFEDILTTEEWHSLEKVARQARTPLPALTLAVYEECLRRWSSNDQFIVTVTGLDARSSLGEVADRTVSHLHRARPWDSLPALLQDVRNEYRYRMSRGVPALEELREGLRAGRHQGLSPYVFTFGATSVLFDSATTAVLGTPEHSWSITPQVLIDCQIARLDERGTTVSFDVRVGAFPEPVARQLFEAFCSSLHQIADKGLEGLGVDDLVTLPALTLQRRAAANGSAPVCRGLLHGQFRRRVAEEPDGLSLIWDPQAVGPVPWTTSVPGKATAAELDRAALRVAAKLSDVTKPTDVVMVHLPKGPAQVVAVLGVLYAGCTYLPYGLDQPAERAAKVAAEAGATVRITESWMSQLPEPLEGPRAVAPDTLAYIIYTSGSTGSPKGVAIAHRAAANTVADVNARHGLRRSDRTLAVSALDFDLSVFDIFGPLSAGGAVVTIVEDQRRDAFAWAELVARNGVTVWNTVPALAEMLCVVAPRTVDAGDPLPLRLVICSGDWVEAGLVRTLHATFLGVDVVAMGGATEGAIWSNEFVVDAAHLREEWTTIPYGLPLSGQHYRVADEHGRDRPDLVPGELWIGGAGVAEGYFHNEILTAERFVERDGDRWYRTGDYGMWYSDPLLIFLGRADTQVKIRGHRIECSEVEHALRRIDGLSDAVVVDIRDRRALGALVRGDACDVGSIREALAPSLPAYMVPSEIRMADSMPLTANGKVDRARVRALIEEPMAAHDVASPSTVIARLWRAALGVAKERDTDNLFELGGDSLTATLLCRRAREAGFDVEVADLFEDPTFAGFSRACHPGRKASITTAASEPDAAQTGPFPLTPLQRAYAVGADGVDGVTRCAPLLGVILRTRDGSPVDVDALRRESRDLVARFEVLRLARTEEVLQEVRASGEVTVEEVAVGTMADVLTACTGSWDDCPAITLLVCRRQPETFGVRLNYLMMDARAIAAVIAALAATAVPQQGEVVSAPIDPSAGAFRHFAVCRAGDEDGPRAHVSLPEPPRLGLAAPAVASCSRSLVMTLSAAQTAALDAASTVEGASVSALVLAQLAAVLAGSASQRTIGITVPISQRPDPGHPDIGETLGNFTRLGLCTLGADGSATEAARQLGLAVAGKLPDEIDIARAGRAAYPVVFTSTTGLGVDETLAVGGLRVVETRTSTPGVLLDCQLERRDGVLTIRWDHPDGVGPRKVLQRLFDRFVAGLVARAGGQAPDPSPVPMAQPSQQPPEKAETIDTWAEEVIVTALSALDAPGTPAVLPRFEATVARWRELAVGQRCAPRHDEAATLVRCVTGSMPVTRLLEDESLSPQALMLRSVAGRRFVQRIADVIRGVACIRIVELGSGDGSLRRAVAAVLGADARGVPAGADWEQVEPDLLLADLASVRGERVVPEPTGRPADLVVAFGSLHRDSRLVHMLRRTGGAELMVGELATAGAISLLSAALLDPRICHQESTALRDPGQWWGMLRDAGWRPFEVTELTPGAFCLRARGAAEASGGASGPAQPRPVASSAPITNEQEPGARSAHAEWTTTRLRGAWRAHLGQEPADDADFFAAGGDSLRATKIVSELRAEGIAVRLVDLFNASSFTELAATLARRPRADTGSAMTAPSSEVAAGWPLTAVQRAYLAGRAPHQILGGVASHCYFEFRTTALDVSALGRAVEAVRARHAELRSVVDGDRMVELAKPPMMLFASPDPRAATEREVPDPSTDPGMVVRYRQGEEAIVGVGMDNLHLDGASMFLALAELGVAYTGGELPPAPPASAIPRHLAQRPWLRGIDSATNESMPDSTRASMADSEHWWRTRVPELPPAPAIASLTEMAAAGVPDIERVERVIARPAWERIRTAAAAGRVTPTALVLAAYARTLCADTGQPACTINLTRFDREPSDIALTGCVGDFTSLVPVRASVSDDLLEMARSVQRDILDATDHQEISLDWISRELLRVTGDPGRAMFPVVFTSGFGLLDGGRLDDIGRLGELTRSRSQTPQTLIDLQIHDDARGVHLSADFTSQLLEHSRAAGWLEGIASALLAISDDEEAGSDDIERVVGDAWSELLGTEAGPATNFFRVGGDSVTATRCIQRLREDLGTDVELRQLFLHPVLADFTAELRSANPLADRDDPETGDTRIEEGVL
ncbi:amino acid adenylation domain-containing protein [Propionibacterium cyclohexanicum]|uniref:Amino acid adenylation domain-containing protein n=1 Tax=Propionibacterium cyclohexanicum TaxID=64702 RepID=A0A1H9RSL4_9ACTN|nr:non-ribosomal peptide synthetase [Propionibacterium cyclohexanicum]SER75820.1 amino acid adenylation domain-containing protein [Propionibacterium cyclohexanicum]